MTEYIKQVEIEIAQYRQAYSVAKPIRIIPGGAWAVLFTLLTIIMIGA